jgi:DNA-binding CsgD family transcriptional regulator/tetratricopeptide (TPR) repeat protein
MPPAKGTAALRALGQDAYLRRAWTDAYVALTEADGLAPLGAADLELIAECAYMLGRDAEWIDALERAHNARLAEGDALAAVRCAFWIGVNLARRGEIGRATGWLSRAQRMLSREEGDHVEQGYLLLPRVFQFEAAGELEVAADTAAKAAAIGERFGEADLFALAVHEQGHILVRLGRIAEGLALLDEAMVWATAGDLSPIVTGIVYCGVIAGCQEAYELGRAQEWTAVLAGWCDEQQDLMAFTGPCLVHRAEIMQLHGEWREALEEARRASARMARTADGIAPAQALYRQGELHRLLGEFAQAEEAYRAASMRGFEPQPGLALLRLAQGSGETAAATIRRIAGDEVEPHRRAGLVAACAEIMLATGDTAAARSACSELELIAAPVESVMLEAMAASTRGAVELAEGDVPAALATLRGAARRWQEIGAPYEAARTRTLVGRACAELGDGDTATMELEAARRAFDELGALPDAAAVASLLAGRREPETHGLTPRELEVLRLLAAGRSNREIASTLVVSEHTVARHVQNILGKLGVSSRTAAGAFAFQHDLV